MENPFSQLKIGRTPLGETGTIAPSPEDKLSSPKGLGDIELPSMAEAMASRPKETMNVSRAAEAGLEGLKGLAYGAGAVAADLVGADKTKEDFISKMKKTDETSQKLTEGLIMSWDQVKDAPDTMNAIGSFIVNNVANQAPNMVATIATALTTGGLGNILAKAGTTGVAASAGLLAKKEAKDAVQDYITNQAYKGLTKLTAEQTAKKALAENTIKSFYANVGGLAASYGMGVGDIAGSSLEASGGATVAPSDALIKAIPYAALDFILPQRIISKIFGAGKGMPMTNAVKEAMIGFGIEGTGEAGQEAILMQQEAKLGKAPTEAEATNRLITSFAAGGLLGGAAGAVGGAIEGAKAEKEPEILNPVTKKPFTNKELSNSYKTLSELVVQREAARDQNLPTTDIDTQIDTIKNSLKERFLTEKLDANGKPVGAVKGIDKVEAEIALKDIEDTVGRLDTRRTTKEATENPIGPSIADISPESLDLVTKKEKGKVYLNTQLQDGSPLAFHPRTVTKTDLKGKKTSTQYQDVYTRDADGSLVQLGTIETTGKDNKTLLEEGVRMAVAHRSNAPVTPVQPTVATPPVEAPEAPTKGKSKKAKATKAPKATTTITPSEIKKNQGKIKEANVAVEQKQVDTEKKAVIQEVISNPAVAPEQVEQVAQEAKANPTDVGEAPIKNTSKVNPFHVQDAYHKRVGGILRTEITLTDGTKFPGSSSFRLNEEIFLPDGSLADVSTVAKIRDIDKNVDIYNKEAPKENRLATKYPAAAKIALEGTFKTSDPNVATMAKESGYEVKATGDNKYEITKGVAGSPASSPEVQPSPEAPSATNQVTQEVAPTEPVVEPVAEPIAEPVVKTKRSRKNAKQVSSTEEVNGRSSTQPEVRQEGRSTTEGSQGVQQEGQGTQVQEVKPVVSPEKLIASVEEDAKKQEALVDRIEEYINLREEVIAYKRNQESFGSSGIQNNAGNAFYDSFPISGDEKLFSEMTREEQANLILDTGEKIEIIEEEGQPEETKRETTVEHDSSNKLYKTLPIEETQLVDTVEENGIFVKKYSPAPNAFLGEDLVKAAPTHGGAVVTAEDKAKKAKEPKAPKEKVVKEKVVKKKATKKEKANLEQGVSITKETATALEESISTNDVEEFKKDAEARIKVLKAQFNALKKEYKDSGIDNTREIRTELWDQMQKIASMLLHPQAALAMMRINKMTLDDFFAVDTGTEIHKDGIAFSKPLGKFSESGMTFEEFLTAKHNLVKKGLDKILAAVPESFKNKVTVKLFRNPKEVGNPRLLQAVAETGGIANGLFLRPGHPALDNTNIAEIYVFTDYQRNTEEAIGTLYHEFVGHYGMRELWGTRWKQFMTKVYSNPKMATEIYDYTKNRWSFIETRFPLEDGGTAVKVTLKNGQTHYISEEAMLAFTDEYVAEKAKELATENKPEQISKILKILRPIINFIRNLIRMDSGVQLNDNHILWVLRDAKRMLFAEGANWSRDPDFEMGLDDAYLKGILDNTIQYSMMNPEQPITDLIPDDFLIWKPIMNAVSKTAKWFGAKQTNYKLPKKYEYDPEVAKERLKEMQRREDLRAYKNKYLKGKQDTIHDVLFSMQDPEVEARETHNTSENNIAAVNELLKSDFTDANVNTKSKLWRNFQESIRQKPWVAKLFSMGALKNERLYNVLSAKAQGEIQRTEILTRKLSKAFKAANLNRLQKLEVLNYIEDAAGNLEALNVPEDIKQIVKESKDTIMELGAKLSELGMLDEGVYQENKGAYLRKRYIKYILSNAGGGKKPSSMDFLKHSVPEEDREVLDKVLGRIRDPQFLLEETLATIGRDTALINFFKNIDLANKSDNLGWILGDEGFIDINGTKVSIDWLDKAIHTQELIIADMKSDKSLTLGSEQELLEAQNLLAQYKTAMEGAKEGLKGNYRQMPDARKFGMLRNKWVRNEIYSDLVDVIRMFTPEEEKGSVRAFFKPGGKLEELHMKWKGIKVPLNPPAWIRNGISNLILMDISTNTNIGKLTYWCTEEIVKAARGNPSEYWTLAQEMGLFGTTFSSQEIYKLQRTSMDRLEKLWREQELKGATKIVKDSFVGAMSTLNEFLSAAGELYGQSEGWFKAVKIRDYLETWNKTNNRDWRTLTGAEREALVGRAAEEANRALFDYSKIPGWLREIRRYPLGAPFITFTYKAFPAMMEGMVTHPQKFIKYLALPYLMMQAFLMANDDMDDDDYKNAVAKLPHYMKDKGSVFIMPYKDAQGRMQAIDFGYYLPWAPYIDWGIWQHNHWMDTGVEAGINNTGGAIAYNFAKGASKLVTTDMGFLGGPIPGMISSLTTGVDPFLGKEIVNPGKLPSEQLVDLTTYIMTMWTPSMIGPTGPLSDILDKMGITVPGISEGGMEDSFGKDKLTGGQIAAKFLGANVKGYDPQQQFAKNQKLMKMEEQKILKARNEMLRGPGSPQEKAEKLRGYNEMLKIHRKNYQ